MSGKGWLKNYFKISNENQHTCIYGVSGSGKTTLLDYFLIKFYESGFNVIIRDVGKGSELSILAQRVPIRLFTFEGIELKSEIDYEIEIVHCHDFTEILSQCSRDKINVISIPYHSIPSNTDRYATFLNIWKEFFTTIIDLAFEYKIQVPAVLGIDEKNTIAPSGHNLPKPLRLILHELIIAYQELRGNQIRFIGTSHGLTELNPYIRKQISWHIFKRLSESPSKKLELETIKNIDMTVKRLNEKQFIIVNPLRQYSHIVEIDLSDYKPDGLIYFTGKIKEDLVAYYSDVGSNKFKMLSKAVSLLVSHGLKQSEIAKKLGVTQGYVSQLLHYSN